MRPSELSMPSKPSAEELSAAAQRLAAYSAAQAGASAEEAAAAGAAAAAAPLQCAIPIPENFQRSEEHFTGKLAGREVQPPAQPSGNPQQDALLAALGLWHVTTVPVGGGGGGGPPTGFGLGAAGAGASSSSSAHSQAYLQQLGAFSAAAALSLQQARVLAGEPCGGAVEISLEAAEGASSSAALAAEARDPAEIDLDA